MNTMAPYSLSKLTDLLPVQIRPHAKWILVGLIGLLLLLWINGIYQRSKPEYTFKVIDGLTTPESIQSHSEYFTPRGKLIWEKMTAHTKEVGKPYSGPKFVYGTPITNEKSWVISMNNGAGTSGSVKLVKEGRWRFDDMYIESSDGKKIELWVSYMIDHPFLTAIKLNWQELGSAFLQGFIWGASGGAL